MYPHATGRADLVADEGELRAEGVRALVQAELVFLGLRARGAAGLRQIADKIGTAFDKLGFQTRPKASIFKQHLDNIWRRELLHIHNLQF